MEFKKNKIEHWQIISLYLILFDVLAVNFSYFMALFLRFDLRYTSIPTVYIRALLTFAPFYTVFTVIVFAFFRLYNSLWRFASISELNRTLAASAVVTLFQIIGMTLFVRRMPISYYVFGAMIQLVLVLGVRFSYRYLILERARRIKDHKAKHRAMIIGAGRAGQMIIKELKSSTEAVSKPVCVIDDNPNKWGRVMEGIPIVGGRDSILEMVNKYDVDQILLAIPSSSMAVRRDILNICKETDCELKTLPGMYQLANGEVSMAKMKPVAVEDLLGRDPIKVNLDEIFNYLQGKTILVTGGGGSIGSELCRQIAGHKPKKLVIFDIYENNVYDIQQELRHNYPDLDLVTLIGSVRDSRRIDSVFKEYRPDVVYHAAAHKHVPLMEDSPNEAVKNNVVGTYKTAYAALKYGTKRFVLISTDKAVNPTNIMGASKRLCEMVIQSMDYISKTGKWNLLPSLCEHLSPITAGKVTDDPEDHDDFLSEGNVQAGVTSYVAVRFGNVLGSNGSVIPLFRKQIAAGGPVTVTHPDIVRYFMTIPEAVSLVLQAGTYANGGEIFILDMGEPVKIDTLARNLIKLSGFRPDVDIKIVYSGLRPGEKLFEEKLMAEEGLQKTKNDLIHIGKPIAFDKEKFFTQLVQLAVASYNNAPDIVERVESVVSTFHPVGSHPTGNEMKKH